MCHAIRWHAQLPNKNPPFHMLTGRPFLLFSSYFRGSYQKAQGLLQKKCLPQPLARKRGSYRKGALTMSCCGIHLGALAGISGKSPSALAESKLLSLRFLLHVAGGAVYACGNLRRAEDLTSKT